MIRRSPVAVYRVIDEAELLGGDDLCDEWGEAALEWPAAEPPVAAPRRTTWWRRVAVPAAVAVALGALALVGIAAPPRAGVVHPSRGVLATLGAAATSPEPWATPRRRGPAAVPRATVLAPPHARPRPTQPPRSSHPARGAGRPPGPQALRRAIRQLATRATRAPRTQAAPVQVRAAPPSPAGEFGFER